LPGSPRPIAAISTFAQKADVEGYNDVAAVFRSTAEGETGHAHGHLEFLEKVGDPATGLPIGPTGDNLKAAIAGETHEYTDMYPGMARSAREEGFDEIADWFETLAKAEKLARQPLPEGTRHPRQLSRGSPSVDHKRELRFPLSVYPSQEMTHVPRRQPRSPHPPSARLGKSAIP
jgi:hypothetical protein